MTKTIFSPVQQKMLFNQIKESDFFNSLINDGNFFDFLSNIWDIDTLPSSDPHFNNLRGDIQQHMFNNDDWDYDSLKLFNCLKRRIYLISLLLKP